MSDYDLDGYHPDIEGLTARARKAVKRGVNDGLFCTDVQEKLPRREKGGCEKVYKGKNNAYIVLGRDRPTTIVSGCGGAGQTQCGMIDMVVGLNALPSSKKRKKGEEPAGPRDVVSPSFATDAARIYMSQRCASRGGIDAYLGLSRTKSPSAMNKSAIALKADHVRIVGRESVRIYAARAQSFQGFGLGGEHNTLGGSIGKTTIELVAGREEDLQPMVLGDNLVKYLKDKDDTLSDILRIVIEIVNQLSELNSSVAFLNPILLKNIPKNIDNFFDGIIAQLNSQIEKINSLNALIISGGNPLLSNTVFGT